MLLRVRTRSPEKSGPAAASPRVARRRERMRASLLAAGARQFAKRGARTVSVEEPIAEADVSRATFYGLFASKYSLLDDILNPVFDKAIAAVRRLAARPPQDIVDQLIDVYLDLWSASRDALLLIPTLDE